MNKSSSQSIEANDKKMRYLVCLLCITFAGVFLSSISDQLPLKSFFNALGTVFGLGAFIEIIKLYIIDDGKGMLSKQLDSIVNLFVKVSSLKSKKKSFVQVGLTEIQFGWVAQKFFDEANKDDIVYWLDTHDPNFKSDTWKLSLKNALSRGANVKMLVMANDSEAAEMRAREINAKWDFFDDQNHFNEFLFEYFSDEVDRGQLEIRMYLDLPCAPVYVIQHPSGEIKSYSSYFLNIRSIEMPHFVCKSDTKNNSQLPNYLMRYFESKWKEAGECWESKFFPIGFWVYRFRDAISNEFVYGRYRIFRHRDGFHAEGEAWFGKDIFNNKEFENDYRLKRRGLWRSRKAFQPTKDEKSGARNYLIPYELVYQKSAGKLAGECYLGDFNFNFSKTLKSDQILKGTLVKSRGESDLGFGENPIFVMRVPHYVENHDTQFPSWLKSQFLNLNKKCEAGKP